MGFINVVLIQIVVVAIKFTNVIDVFKFIVILIQSVNS